MIEKIMTMPLNVFRIFLVGFTALLLLVLPHLNNQLYIFSTITTKFIYFVYGCLILAIIYSLILVISKTVLFSFSKIDAVLLILIIYITLNRYFIQSHFGFSIRYLELLYLSFIYVVLRSIKLRNYPWLLLALVCSGIIQAVYGNLQLIGYYPSNHSGFKMTGSFFNPGPYAGFLSSIWSVALGMYLFKESITSNMQSKIVSNSLFLKKIIKYTFEYIPLLGLICISIVLPATQSRASWITALVGTGVLLEFKSNFLRKLIIRIQKAILISFSFVVLGTGLFSLYHYKKASSDGRVLIWKVTAEMIAEAPLFGVGFDFFKAHYMDYQAQYFYKNGETSEALLADNTGYAFNELLQFVAENGFSGFILLLIAGFVLFQTRVKPADSMVALMAKTGLLAIGVFACFSYPMQILPIKLVLMVLLALLSGSAVDPYLLKMGLNKRNQWFYKSIVLLVAFIIIFRTFAYTKDLSQGYITWNNAVNNYQYEDYKVAIKEFELAYPIFKKDGDFLMNYGKTLTIAGQPTKAIAILQQARHYQNNTVVATSLGDSYKATKRYDKAEDCYQQAINMTPSKFYANYLLAKLYDASGQEKKAVALANKLMDKEIKIPSTAIEEIHNEMKKILAKYKNPPGI